MTFFRFFPIFYCEMKSPIETRLGFKFKSQKLLKAALTHPSYQLDDKSNLQYQRLEFLGDSILGSYIAKKLYDLYPDANEGLLTRLRSILVCRRLLAKVAIKFGLKKYISVGEFEKKESFLYEKILADSFEALVGAIYLDKGKKVLDKFLLCCFEPHLSQKKLFDFHPNPKSTLQEYTQKNHASLPAYVSRLDPKKNIFSAWVTIQGKKKTKGLGRTKREAEADAATRLIKKLKIKKTTFSAKENVPIS